MKRAFCLLLTLVLLVGLLPPAHASQTDHGLTVETVYISDDSISTYAPPKTASGYALVRNAGQAEGYYGRNALSALENATALLYAYDQLAAGIAASEATISIYDGVHALTQAQAQIVMDAYRKDYVHHFWLGNSYRIAYNSKTVVNILPSYIMTGDDLAAAKNAMEASAAGLLAGITDTMSEYEKALYLHDALAAIVTYSESSNAHNAYGALVEGIAVCEGYAESLQYLMQRAGLTCFLAEGAGLDPVTGSAVAHAWNYVRIDGEFYHIDLTWDDQGDTLYHAYFGLTDTQILEDHLLDATGYPLPLCNSSDAFYFAGSQAYLDTYSTDRVAALLQQNGRKAHVYIPGSVDAFLAWYRENILDIASQAGMTGGFSYSYSMLGHEIVLQLKKICSHNYANGICLVCGHINAASGSTVPLSADLSADEITVPAGVTLDLNGYRLTAAYVASFGSIIDTTGNGCLVTQELLLTENPYLPIYDSAAAGYRFFAYELENLGVREQENGAIFGFSLAFTDSRAYQLLAGEEVPGFQVTASLSWESGNADFVFDTNLIQQYALLQLRYPQLRSALMLKVNGIDSLPTGSGVTVTPGLSAGQLVCNGDPMDYFVD